MLQHKNLEKFLKKHRVYSKDGEYTHVSMGPPYGKFKIEDDALVEFYGIYSECVGKCDLYIAEKPVDISLFIIDLDFIQDIPIRKYTYDDILSILQISDTIIKQCYDVHDDYLLSFVLEKNNPTLKNEHYKDGIHIIYPYLRISKIMRQYILNEIIELAKIKSLFNNLNFLNAIDNIIDPAVVIVPWLMFGSKKLNGNVYHVSYYIKNLQKVFLNHIPTIDLVKLLSTRKFINSQESKLKISHEITKDKDEDEDEDKYINNVTTIINNEMKEIEMAKKLVSILSYHRSQNYNKWCEIGWSLRNTSGMLLNTFIEFSQKCPTSYNYHACKHFWDNVNSGNLSGKLTIRSLHYWAKSDNPEEYNKIMLELHDQTLYDNQTLDDNQLIDIPPNVYPLDITI